MKTRLITAVMGSLIVAAVISAPAVQAQRKHQNAVIDIWAQGKPVFGVYVPATGQPLWSDPPAANRGNRGQAPQPGVPPVAGGSGRAQVRPDPFYTREIGEALAKDPLVDFAFLNEEGL